jgi:DNA mismatch repair protein MutL
VTRRIVVLPDGVANQIAAGEVVERPASVVKELVENALDARATRVDILLEGGGKRRIRVSDNGTGMSREDALLSLDRHATSKIREAGDLAGVRTFGFRGEALPSIAAVARMSLETRDPGDDAGTAIRIEGGRIVAVDDHPRQPGTSVDVRTLFHNAPVRARFLRSAAAETRAASEVVIALALAHPGVALTLRSDDRVLLDLPPTEDLLGRVAAIWGEDAAGDLIPVSGEGNGFGLRGLVQRPDRVRPGFRRAYLFNRGRPFREPALLRAADRAYRTTIPEGHRPWVFLYLQSPDGTVDVNVHPAKAEVRFRDLAGVERLVEEVVRDGLRGEGSAAALDPQLARARPRDPVRPFTEGGTAAPGTLQTSLFVAGASGSPGGRQGDAGGELPPASLPEDGGDGGWSAAGEEGSPGEGAGSGGSGRPEPTAGGGVPGGSAGNAGVGVVPGSPTPAAGAAVPPGSASRIWQVLDRYILAEVRDGLLLIDQHAAHERILFERIIRAFDQGGIEAQQLLFPLTLRLSPPEYEMVTSMTGLFARVGFQVEGFGGNTVAVHAVPDPHPHFDAERALREMIEELTHGSPLLRSARNQVERLAMSFACQGAIKAGQPLAQREIQELFDSLFATELPYHDVHGRPTTVRLTRAELERTFGR